MREVAAGEVPVELLRLDDPAWWSRESALDWIDTEGISTEVLDSQSAASLQFMPQDFSTMLVLGSRMSVTRPALHQVMSQ